MRWPKARGRRGDLIMHRPNEECQNRRLSRGVRWPYENARFGVLTSKNQKKEGIARIGFGAIGAISRLLRRYQRQTKQIGDGMRQPR